MLVRFLLVEGWIFKKLLRGYELAFFTTEIERLRIAEKIIDNPELLKLLCDVQEGLSVIDEYARKKLTEKQDDFLTIQVTGEQGSGKSGLAQKLASKYATRTFTAERITLHYDNFLELVRSSKQGDFTILDEQTKTHGIGSQRLKDDIINIIETLRFAGASIIIVSPTEKMVGVEDVHLTIEVLGLDPPYILVAYKSRSDRFLGVLKIELDWANQLWVDYQEGKKAYVKDAQNLEFRKQDYEKLAERVLVHPDAVYCTKQREYLLLMEKIIPNLTTEEKKLVITQIKLNEKKKGKEF